MHSTCIQDIAATLVARSTFNAILYQRRLGGNNEETYSAIRALYRFISLEVIGLYTRSVQVHATHALPSTDQHNILHR